MKKDKSKVQNEKFRNISHKDILLDNYITDLLIPNIISLKRQLEVLNSCWKKAWDGQDSFAESSAPYKLCATIIYYVE